MLDNYINRFSVSFKQIRHTQKQMRDVQFWFWLLYLILFLGHTLFFFFFFERRLTIYVYVNCVLRQTFTVHDYARSLSWPGPVRSEKPWYRFSTVTAGLRRSRYYRNNCVTFVVYSNNSTQDDIRCNTIKSNPQSDFSCCLNFVNFDLLTQRSLW